MTTRRKKPSAAPRRPRPQRRAGPRRRARPRRPRAEQPLGVGVGDAFAVQRLNVPVRARREDGLREVGWAEFGELARDLAGRVAAAFRPDLVLGIVNGGIFLGGALAVHLGAEFQSLRVRKFGRRSVPERPGDLTGRAVLVVDDVTVSGRTLGTACAAARKAGAREVRSAALVVRPDGHAADFHALNTRDLVVFGWDYQLQGAAPGAVDPGEVGV